MVSEELKPVAWRINAMEGCDALPRFHYYEADPPGLAPFAREPLYSQATVSALQSRIAELEAKAKLPEALHTFLNAAGGEGLVLDGVDAGDLYEQLFPERYQEQTDKAFASWEPAIDAAIAAKEHPHG